VQGAAHAPGAHNRALLDARPLDLRRSQARASSAHRKGRRRGLLSLDADQVRHHLRHARRTTAARRKPLRALAQPKDLILR
jgi:hypothetical protein